jgi:hypothetical protein
MGACPRTGEVGEAARCGPGIVPGGGSNGFEPDSNFKRIQIILKLSKVWTIQKDVPELEKIGIKYGCKFFEQANNSLHRNFFTFEMDFELKIWEFKVCF